MGSEPMTQIETLHSKIRPALTRFCMDESAATAIEYALVAGGIGVAVAGTVMSLGSTLKTAFYDKIGAMFD
jgi:pilus assembly protein Flp/PilA